MDTVAATESDIPAVAKPARPGWTGFRWGLGAGGLYALLGGLALGFFATVWDAGADFTLAEALPTLAIFFLPALLGGMLVGGIGGAITMLIVHWLLRKMPNAGRWRVFIVTVGVCLLLMLLVATPALLLLYSDGNFWRGLEESLIFGIPFYFLPGFFYIVAMILGTLLNYSRWFPERTSTTTL